MWDWLNRAAPAVQALAAVASVLVAAVLGGVTYRYVRLTQSLLENARQQLDFICQLQATRDEQDRIRIVTLIDRLRHITTTLLPERETAGFTRLLSVALWNQKSSSNCGD